MSASIRPVPPASSGCAGTAESHGAGKSAERLKKTRASFKHQPMFVAWPDQTNPVGFCVPGPGETPGEGTDASLSQLHPCYLPSAGLFRHIAFLLSLLHSSHYRVPLISQSTSLAMCQRGGAVQTCGWPAEGYPGLGGADPCTPSLFPECILRLFPSYCPSTTPGFTEIFKLHF